MKAPTPLHIRKTINTLLDKHFGKVFQVTFITKAGEIRKYNLKEGVKKDLKGGSNNQEHYPQYKNGYLMNGQDNTGKRKTFNTDCVLNIKVGGNDFDVQGYTDAVKNLLIKDEEKDTLISQYKEG